MKAPFNMCIECDEAITNPICSDCLATTMRVMIAEYDQKLAQKVVGFSMEDGITTCIQCGQSMSLCAHCFSRDIYEYLQERNPAIAEEFVNRFDFDLRQELV